jgi:hypothetical protein
VAVVAAYSWNHNSQSASGPDKTFIAALFAGRTTPVTVVVQDTALQNYRFVVGKTVPLASYLTRRYVEAPEGASGLQDRLWSQFGKSAALTNTESVAAAVKLAGALTPYGITVRHPSEMSTPSFETESVILLGGPYVNPWVQLFEGRLNFRTLATPGSVVSELQNMNPRGGEPELYLAHSENGVQVSYLRVAVLPNLAGTGHVVLLGGVSGGTMEAACSFLSRPGSLDEILNRFHVAAISKLPPFELLIEIHAFSRTSLNMKIVADRLVQPSAPTPYQPPPNTP